MALQFTAMMAGCRLFYVPGDVLNVSYTWVRVAREGGGFVLMGRLGMAR